MPAEGTRHVVRKEVQRQSARVEFVLALQLYTIVNARVKHPCGGRSAYLDLRRRNVEYIALYTSVGGMQHHIEHIAVLTLQAHPGGRYGTHATLQVVVNIHMT